MSPDRTRIIIEFERAESGLTTNDQKMPAWFRFYRKGDVYFKDLRPASARIIDKNNVEIIYDQESEELWLNVERGAEQNLCNGAGLPAYPFRKPIPKPKPSAKPAEPKTP
jgi:hypothetical protein